MRATFAAAAALAVAMLLAAAAAPGAAAFMLPNKPSGGACAAGTGQPAKLALAVQLLDMVGKGGKVPTVCLKCEQGTFSWGNSTGPCLPCSACPGLCQDGLCSTLVTFDDIDASAEPLYISELPYYNGFYWGAGVTGVLQPGVTPLTNCTGSEAGAGYSQVVVSKPNAMATDADENGPNPTIFWPALNPGQRFVLRSFYASAAYRNGQTIKVEGLDAAAPVAAVVATFTATVSTTARVFLDFSRVAGFQSVAAIRITTFGGTPAGLCGGRTGLAVGVDNLLTSYVEPVPDGKKKAAAAASSKRAKPNGLRV